jgi:sortase A
MTFEASHSASAPRSRPRKPRRKVSVLGVIGELLITAGVLVLLFLGWQVWLNDIIVGGEQTAAAGELGQSWAEAAETAPSTEPPTDASTDPALPAEPVVMEAPGNAEKFAILMVPRWGADYERNIAEGVGVSDVLNKIGLGHYPSTQMPGEVGNFAIASHRKAYGGGFEHLHELQLGDHIYVETADGWYSYVYRSSEYVLSSGIGVIDEVPQRPDASPTDRLITLTTCNPFFSTAERLIAYGVFDGWYPRADGPPAEIAGTINARGN